MSTFSYDSYLDDVFRGSVTANDIYYVLLASSAYTPDQSADMKRADVTGEVAGIGYDAGGKQVVPVFVKDVNNHRLQITFPAVSWPASSIAARYAVYYKRRGGAASLDELVAVKDFGANVSTDTGTFALGAVTITINTPA
jgi:hypothetical protein